ncbi:MAG: AAA family ATPase [Actinomycetota bacterium]
MNATSAELLHLAFSPDRLLERLEDDVVGLRREAEVLATALETGRHVVLEGPPGVGKSTLLRAVADQVGWGVAFVEGNAELTPGRLVGGHDPALVLDGGYRPEAFMEGPLVSAMRSGSLLYIEEFNRVPEETLNVLITALAEGEIHVPRLGHIRADDKFRLIAAMNPFDAVGTARVGQAIYDRMCRIAMAYQGEEAERAIVERVTGITGEPAALAVAIARATRAHPAVRTGASVRGAIDMVLLGEGLATLRAEPAPTRTTLLDAALAAFSGRIRVEDGREETPEAIITSILDALLLEPEEGSNRGKAPSPPAGPAPDTASHGRTLEGDNARATVEDSARQTTGRADLSRMHPQLADVSPEVGVLDDAALDLLLAEDLDEGIALLCDLSRATDVQLRSLARQAARRVFFRLASRGPVARRGIRRLVAEPGSEGDLDLERSVERAGGRRPRRPEDMVVRRWEAAERAICLLVDRSGSMSGAAVGTAALAAASVVIAAGEQTDCSVIAFAHDAVVLQRQGQRRPPGELVDDILALRGKGTTDLALALRAASSQLARSAAGDRVAVLLSDCLPTAGGDPALALGGLDHLHVVGVSDEPESVAAGRALARQGRGRHGLALRPSLVPAVMTATLA